VKREREREREREYEYEYEYECFIPYKAYAPFGRGVHNTNYNSCAKKKNIY
jgi:hypothetical protein